MLRARQSSFLVWISSTPEARRRAHAYCAARGWQLDWVSGWQFDWSGNPPRPLAGEALRVDPRRYMLLARQCVMRGEYEPLPNQGT
jgi:hypothetical protein